jgi:hypothetical protein
MVLADVVSRVLIGVLKISVLTDENGKNTGATYERSVSDVQTDLKGIHVRLYSLFLLVYRTQTATMIEEAVAVGACLPW